MLIEFWSKFLHYLYFPDDLITYLDVGVRLLFSAYYLPLWGLVFAILHSTLESIVYTLIVPAALEVQRAVHLGGRSHLEAAVMAAVSAAAGGSGGEADGTADAAAGMGSSAFQLQHQQTQRLLLGSQVLESLVPSFLAPFIGHADLPMPLRVVLECIVVLATLIPHGALAVASCVIGHKLMTVITEAMVDAFSRLEDGKDYPLVAARIRFVSKNPRRFSIFAAVCGVMSYGYFGLVSTAAVIEYADRPMDVLFVAGAIISAALCFMVGTAIYRAPQGIRILARPKRYVKVSSSGAAKNSNSCGGGAALVSPTNRKRGKSSTARRGSLLTSPKATSPSHPSLAAADADATIPRPLVLPSPSLSSPLPPSAHLESVLPSITTTPDSAASSSVLYSVSSVSTNPFGSGIGGDDAGGEGRFRPPPLPSSSPSLLGADYIDNTLSEYEDTDGYYREGRKRYHFMYANGSNNNAASPNNNNSNNANNNNNNSGAGGGAALLHRSALASQELRLRLMDRFLPCPSPELVTYVTGPWWEQNIHRVRHMAVEALVVYFTLNTLFGSGFIASAPKAVEIMIYLNIPHLMGFLALTVSESIIRKTHSLLWLYRHSDQLPSILLVAAPYMGLLIYCTMYFFPAPIPTATLVFATLHQGFRAVDLARWYEVSPQGGGVQWVELRPAAPAPQVISAAMHVLSGKRHRPLFVPSTPSGAVGVGVGRTHRHNGSFSSRQPSEEPTTTAAVGGLSLDDTARASSIFNASTGTLSDLAMTFGSPLTVGGGAEPVTPAPHAAPPIEIPVHDSYAIMLEDAKQRGKSDLGVVGLDTAADIGLMRLYRRGQTLPSKLERRVIVHDNTNNSANNGGGGALISPTASRSASRAARGKSSASHDANSGTKGGANGGDSPSSLSPSSPAPRQQQSFLAFAFPRSLLLLGAGSFSGTRFMNVRRAQKYFTWLLLSVFGVLLVALSLQSVIPALQPSPMGVAIDERGYTRASLDHLVIQLSFLAKGTTVNTAPNGNTAEGEGGNAGDERSARAADAHAKRMLQMDKAALVASSPFAPADHTVGEWAEDSEDEYPGLCQSTFGNNVSVFELSIFSLLAYLPTARDVERVLTFLNVNMGTRWSLATSLWANGTFADRPPEACWAHQPPLQQQQHQKKGSSSSSSSSYSDYILSLCAEANRSRAHDWNGFFEFYDAERDMRVVAVKGTDPTSIMDVLQDVNMFFEAALYQILSGVVPFAGILPTSLATDFIRLASMTDVLSRRSLWDPKAPHNDGASEAPSSDVVFDNASSSSEEGIVENTTTADGAANDTDTGIAANVNASGNTNSSGEEGSESWQQQMEAMTEDLRGLSEGFLRGLLEAFGLGEAVTNTSNTTTVASGEDNSSASESDNIATDEEIPPNSLEQVVNDTRRRLERLQALVTEKAAVLPEVIATSELSRVTSERDYHLRVMRYVEGRLVAMAREANMPTTPPPPRTAATNSSSKGRAPSSSSSSSSSSPDSALYFHPISLRERVIMTGHSMGGAIAHIAGTRLKMRSVAFGSPGLVLSHKKFGIRELKSVHARAVTVASSNDIVPMIGWQGGQVHHMECAAKASASELCHVMEFMIGALWHNCPSIRRRYPNMEDVI